jgi:hypothetical protein
VLVDHIDADLELAPAPDPSYVGRELRAGWDVNRPIQQCPDWDGDGQPDSFAAGFFGSADRSAGCALGGATRNAALGWGLPVFVAVVAWGLRRRRTHRPPAR